MSAAKLGREPSPAVLAARQRYWTKLTPEERRAKTLIARRGLRRVSSMERVVADVLLAEGIAFTPQAEIGWYHVDFLLWAQPIVIEVDGCYWHGCVECGYAQASRPIVAARDRAKVTYLTRHAYQVVSIKEHAVRKDARAAVLAALAAAEETIQMVRRGGPLLSSAE